MRNLGIVNCRWCGKQTDPGMPGYCTLTTKQTSSYRTYKEFCSPECLLVAQVELEYGPKPATLWDHGIPAWTA